MKIHRKLFVYPNLQIKTAFYLTSFKNQKKVGLLFALCLTLYIMFLYRLIYPLHRVLRTIHVIKVAIVLILHEVLAHRLQQLQVHRHRLLIQSCIQCLLDEIRFDIHR